MPKITWKFKINGTPESLYPDDWNLKFNPFPQHGKAELDIYDRVLQSLEEPSTDPNTIQRKLFPLFTQEFIDQVILRYRVNTVVECQVTCEWV